jgi:hypothetical protein
MFPIHKSKCAGPVCVVMLETLLPEVGTDLISLPVNFQLLLVEAWFPSQVGPCGIYGGQNSTETGFSQSNSLFPCVQHSNMLYS